MFQRSRNWLRRNRSGLAIGAGLVGVGYLAGQYVVNKITETRQRMNEERVAKENLRRRFQQNQDDCTYTVLALLPTATELVLQKLPVEDIIRELQSRKSDKQPRSTTPSEIATSEITSNVDDEGQSSNSGYVHASRAALDHGNSAGGAAAGSNIYSGSSKMQLWNQLKTSSITRAVTLIYTLSLLTLLTRIQLNLLGRRTYISSVVSLATPSYGDAGIKLENRDDDNFEQNVGDDFDTNREYLTFSWWLLHRGWAMIMEDVEMAVKEAFGSLPPRGEVTFEQLSELVVLVRKKVEGNTAEERRQRSWLRYLLPTVSEEVTVLRESGTTSSSPSETPSLDRHDYVITPALRRLLDETSDLIESPTATGVLTQLLDSAFSLMIDGKIKPQIYGNDIEDDQEHIGVTDVKEVGVEISTSVPKRAKLATILALITRQAHVIGSGGDLSSLSEASPKGGVFADTNTPQNGYLAAMEAVSDLEAFAAVIYSSNFDDLGYAGT